MILSLALLLAAAQPPARTGTLVLDAERPVIDVDVGGVSLRLRVDLDQRDVIELNPDAAARLPLAWESGFDADLGGTQLSGRQAAAEMRVADRTMMVPVATHGRTCCRDADGAVGPLLLPYASVRWRRAPTASGHEVARRFRMTMDESDGLSVREAGVAVQLSLGAPETLASRAAGVVLAEDHGGRFAGPYEQIAGPFDVSRATRLVRFAQPATLLGLRLPELRMRTGDFGGRLQMPEERAQAGDIVVQRRTRAQRRWPVVVLGRDQLDQCREIAFHAPSLALDLVCADAPAPAPPDGGGGAGAEPGGQ